MKDIELKTDGNLVSVKYYNEEFKMGFGRDSTVGDDVVSIFMALDFLLYLLKKKYNGHYRDLTMFSNGRIHYNKMSFRNSVDLLAKLMVKDF